MTYRYTGKAPIEPTDECYLTMAVVDEESCKAVCDGFVCTRTKGHDGDHAAHGGPPIFAMWSDEDCQK